jgi:hypothetical protein
MRKVKEALEVRLGQRGDELDMAVTRRDMVDSGFAKVFSHGKYLTIRTAPPNPVFVPIVGEGDPYGDISVPLYPTGVEIYSSASYNLIVWSPTAELFVERAEVWRGTSVDPALAVFLGNGNQVYGDDISDDPAVPYYYFVRFVSYKGYESPWHSLTGTLATASITDDALRVIAADKVFGASGVFLDLVAENGSISNAMIGNTIQSDNYVPGVAGWIIKK